MAENTSQADVDLELDRIVHEPARLKILAYLSAVKSADFVFLLSRTGLTYGNLSSHMSKLEEVGYIEVEKEIKDKRPHTMLSLTDKGRTAFEDYRKHMLDLLGNG
ncbi:MAG: winged helix-turn-helix domain-containing protein [Anaerolineales bacterium]|jgi:DNA-binding MarR family transcriptional regulator